MLLAMMFSCQPVTEDIDSGNSNSNNTDQGGNTGGGGGNSGGGAGNNENENNTLTVGGTGVYNYSLYIDEIDGNQACPYFSILLLKDSQLEILSDDNNYNDDLAFLEASKTEPIYHICSYGDMRASTANSGNYAVWGETPVDGSFQYYNGVAAGINGTAFSVTVDMTKLANIQLKSYLNTEETTMTNTDTVMLSGYKPYVIGLGDYDSEGYIMYLDRFDGRLCKMNVGASFPTDLKKDAPAVPSFKDLTYCMSNMSQYPIKLENNSFAFVASTAPIYFYFTNYGYDTQSQPVIYLGVGDVLIDDLNKEFQVQLKDRINQPCVFNPGVLTVGKMYTVALIVKSEHEAYIKVSELKPTDISVNSTNHKTSYYIGDDFDGTNLTVEATTSNGKETIYVTPDMISDFDSSTLGKKTVTITVGDCKTTFDIEVKEIKEITKEATASNVVDVISGLTAGEYYIIKLSGEITSNTIDSIREAMYDNREAKISLDLSGTTGLTATSWNGFSGLDNLTGVVLPDSLTELDGYAFSSCSNLPSITIGENVTVIHEYAFRGCEKLTKFDVSENNPKFSSSADGKMLLSKDKTILIAYPSATGDVIIPDGVKKIEKYVFGECENLTSIVIPDSVTTIGESAFQSCRSLTSIDIPNGVVTIGSGAFEDCENLESVTIPDSVTDIDGGMFERCNNLVKFNVSTSNENYSTLADGKILCNKDKAELITYPSATGDITIPDGVTIIGEYSFYACDLTNVIIPGSVTTIGTYAFNACYNLTEIEIPDSVTCIDRYAFRECDDLTNVTIGKNVSSIGSGAFEYCDNLASVTFKNTNNWYYTNRYDSSYIDGTAVDVTNPSQNAAYLRDYYSSYSWYSIVLSDDGNIVFNKDKTELISYSNACGDITIPDGIRKIGNRAFEDCSGLTSVVIPDCVTSIGNRAFYGCENLTSVAIPDSVTEIGEYAFSDCDSLVSVVIPDNVTKIENNMFYDCESLVSVVIPDSVTEIGEAAFSWCTNLTSVAIPDSVTEIGEAAFYYCYALTSVTIPDSVTSIGNRAFEDCSGLTSVVIPDSVTSIGSGIFYDCYNLKSVTFKDTSTWYCTDGYSDDIQVNVTNATANVTHFKDTYSYYQWYKK